MTSAQLTLRASDSSDGDGRTGALDANRDRDRDARPGLILDLKGERKLRRRRYRRPLDIGALLEVLPDLDGERQPRWRRSYRCPLDRTNRDRDTDTRPGVLPDLGGSGSYGGGGGNSAHLSPVHGPVRYPTSMASGGYTEAGS